MQFKYETNVIEFSVIRTQRKTMCIYIKPTGIIEVRAPLKVPQKTILKAVESKGKWIIEKQAEMRKREEDKIKDKAVNEELFMYLGEQYP